MLLLIGALSGDGGPIGLQIARNPRMANGTVVLLGNLPIERLMLDCLVTEFGFSFKHVPTLDCLKNLKQQDAVAVVFRPSALNLEWDEALEAVIDALPAAFPILCHGFADHLDWPRAADAGAFHSIHVPFSIAELRQSLGFVWGAKSAGRPARPIPAVATRNVA
jgi:hypothetical protein